MSFLKKILYLLFLIYDGFIFVFLSQNAFSQDNPKIFDNKILYNKEMSGSIIAHTHGLGLNYRKSSHITGFRKSIFEIDLVGMKHNKEIKSYNINYSNSKGYVYGKLNSFTILRTGYGMQQVLNEKPYRGGVEVGSLLVGGLDIGFLKPIYVIVTDPNDNTKFVVKKYNFDVNYEDIEGKASFINGFDQIKCKLGLFAKLGFNFDFGSYYEFIKALQIGAVIDVYPKPIPIMALAKNNNIFFNFYLSLNFGKRYN